MIEWFTGIFQSMGGFFESLSISAVNPWMALGAVAVASPIIIHLLSKRKFKVVDWAAMDFLLDANRRNRRRVRLENLLLLLLRCLVCILLALLITRPLYKPQGLAAKALRASTLERIVLLDDSPSMTARSNNKTIFDDARDGVVSFINEMSSERSGDSMTLILTSSPNRPLVAGKAMDTKSAEELVRTVQNLKPSDISVQMDKALLEVEKSLKERSNNVNRVVYLISDMRRREWASTDATPKDRTVAALVKRIADQAQGCFLVDVGNDQIDNLAIAEIAPVNKTLVASVESQFQVTVQNNGEQDADDVEVKLFPGDGLELVNHIPQIRSRESGSTLFNVTFSEVGAVPVRAEIRADGMAADNVRYFAARVHDGVKVLLVSGDPLDVKSETYHLRTFFNAKGSASTGVVATEIAESSFEGADLSQYQAIWLCNVSPPNLSEKRLKGDKDTKGLEDWVREGGGLIFTLGDQVDEEAYNQQLYENGKGLLPIKLDGKLGDESKKTWVSFATEAPNHPLLKSFRDYQVTFCPATPIFRWWHGSLSPTELTAGRVSLVVSFTDADSSPAVVEKPFGAGHVVAITTPLCGQWNFWETDPTEPMAFLDFNSYVARKLVGEGNLTVGTPIHHEFDPSKFARDAKLQPPVGDSQTIQATEIPAAARRNEADSWSLDYEDAAAVGIYQLAMNRITGETQNVMFAANLDASESDLHRVEDSELRKMFADSKVEISHGRAALTLGAIGARDEYWKKILLLLVVALCCEQGLAWYFGQKRQ